MRIIQKTVSLNEYVSRLPGVIPTVGEENIKISEQNRAGFGNYNTIPSDIIIPDFIASGITDYTDIYVNIPTNESGCDRSDDSYFYNMSPKSSKSSNSYIENRHLIIDGKEVKIISYQTLKKWYHWMKDYMYLLESTECKTFKSAADYFDLMIHGTSAERIEYEDMDSLFESRGGWDFYNWVTTNFIPKFDIPKTYKDAWNTNFLYYPEVVRWYGWMKNRYGKYGEDPECIDTKECCDCSDYVARGGLDMINLMSEWIESVNIEVGDNDKYFTHEASLNIPILLTRSIDNMGEMSPMVKEWEDGVNYEVTLSESQRIKDSTGGTVVVYDNDSYIIRDGEVGYKYDNTLKQFVFGNKIIVHENINKELSEYDLTQQYNNYTLKYLTEHKDLFVPIQTYTYNRNGVLIQNPTKEKLAETFSYTKKDYVNYGGTLYPIENGYFVTFNGGSEYMNNGIKLQVKWTTNNVPYVIVNRRTYTGKEYLGEYYFKFFSDTAKNKPMSKMFSGMYININGRIIDVDTESEYVYIDSGSSLRRCEVVNGVFIDEHNNTLYVIGDKLYKDTYLESSVADEDVKYGSYIIQTVEEFKSDYWNDYYIDTQNEEIKLYFNYVEHQCSLITGYTSNKLENVHDSAFSVDDMGNQLPGSYIAKRLETENSSGSTVYTQPYEGQMLDLYYHVGNTVSLEKCDFDDKLFTGNVIESMKFYAKYKSGDVNDDMYVFIGTDKNGQFYAENASGETYDDFSTTSNLWAIEELKNMISGYNEHCDEVNSSEDVVDSGTNPDVISYDDDEYMDDSKIYCDITYYIGAILSQVNITSDTSTYEYVLNPSTSYLNLSRKAKFGREIKIDSEEIKTPETTTIAIGYYVATNDDGEYEYFPGIKYKDTLELTPTECYYNLSSDDSYPLNYYKIDVNGYDPDKMNEMVEGDVTSHSYFETPILIYKYNGEKVVPQHEYHTSSKYFDDYNGVIAYPLIRIPYKFGSSSMENLNNDIYVDRGSISILDRYLKLEEVKSLESLENYSNGWFNIKSNS